LHSFESTTGQKKAASKNSIPCTNFRRLTSLSIAAWSPLYSLLALFCRSHTYGPLPPSLFPSLSPEG
jgi:hypothetical protein